MTVQEIFDRVWLRAQTKSRSQREESDGRKMCLYRGAPNGLPCFMGACITDEEYDPNMENTSACDLLSPPNPYYFPSVFRFPQLKHLEEHKGLLSRMQNIHDDIDPEEWENELRSLAAEYGAKLP